MTQELKQIALDLSSISENVIDILLLDDSTEPSQFDEIAQKNTHRPNILHYLLNHPLTPEHTKRFIAKILHLPVPQKTAIKPAFKTVEEVQTADEAQTADETQSKLRVQTLLQKIQSLKIGEKMQLAFRGSRDIRTLLLRDPNKEVVMAVLENPKITESEIELLAKQHTTPVEILRAIDKKREWVRIYSIAHALVTNPKTPVGIALKHIHTLRIKDLSLLEKNKNIPEAIRATAKKLAKARRYS